MAYRAMEGSTPNLASPSLGAELGFATVYQSIRLTRAECKTLIDQYVKVVELLDQRIRVEKTEERRNEANEVRLDRAAERLNVSSQLMAQTRVNLLENLSGAEGLEGLYPMLDTAKGELSELNSYCAEHQTDEKVLEERKDSLVKELNKASRYASDILKFRCNPRGRANGFFYSRSNIKGSTSVLQGISDNMEKTSLVKKELDQWHLDKSALDTVAQNDTIKKDIMSDYATSLEDEISSSGEKLWWLKIEQSQLLGRAVYLRSQEADFAEKAQNNRDRLAILEASRLTMLRNIQHLQAM